MDILKYVNNRKWIHPNLNDLEVGNRIYQFSDKGYYVWTVTKIGHTH